MASPATPAAEATIYAPHLIKEPQVSNNFGPPRSKEHLEAASLPSQCREVGETLSSQIGKNVQPSLTSIAQSKSFAAVVKGVTPCPQGVRKKASVKNGLFTVIFSEEEIKHSIFPFKFAMIAKFDTPRPSVDEKNLEVSTPKDRGNKEKPLEHSKLIHENTGLPLGCDSEDWVTDEDTDIVPDSHVPFLPHDSC